MSRFALTFVLLFACSAGADDTPLAAKLAGVRPVLFAKAPGYSEGPTWRNGELFFCSGALLRVAADGTVDKFLDINPAGTCLRGVGTLLIADNKHKAILALSPEGKLAVLADNLNGKPFRSLNDLTIEHARGNVYWTDPEGSSAANPVGNIFRLTPEGVVSVVGTGLAFPNGLDVDPAGKFLYVVESQSKKVLRYAVPADDQPLGKAEVFYDLGGVGGDGCAFDAEGNIWVADYQRPETKQGRIAILSPDAKLLATIPVPAEVVSNITFGGKDHDEIFCTTGGPPGVFHAKVGVKGFRGHPGKPGKVIRELPVALNDSASPLHHRQFGRADRVETIRGWYFWRKFDADTWEAEVAKDAKDGEVYRVRVLPWATTYRYLTYGAHPADLKPGERVNVFFAADERHPRGYVVHFQDEIGQMKGHGHSWQITALAAAGFTARPVAGDKPIEELPRDFVTSPGTRFALKRDLAVGDKVLLTWCVTDGRNVVALVADAAGLEIVQKEFAATVAKRLEVEGVAGEWRSIDGDKAEFTIYSTFWSQANALRAGQTVTISRTGKGYRPEGDRVQAAVVAKQNRGTYGSGVTDVTLKLATAGAEKWPTGAVLRLLAK